MRVFSTKTVRALQITWLVQLTLGCSLESPQDTRNQSKFPSFNYLSAPANAKARQAYETKNEAQARRVNVILAGPAIGTSPHYLAYSVDLPSEQTVGADFLWTDNGLWIGDQPRGVKILEAPGLHKISVLVVTADGTEYRGAATIQVLDRGPTASATPSMAKSPSTRTEPIAAARRIDLPNADLSPSGPAQVKDADSSDKTHAKSPGASELGSECDIGKLAKKSKSGTQIRIAVLDFQVGSGRNAEEGRALGDLCRSAVADAQAFSLLDRENMRTILGEHDFAEVMRCEVTKCVAKYGKILKAQKMIHGRVSRLGGSQVVYLAVTDVETAEIEFTKKRVIAGKLEEEWSEIEDMTCSLLKNMLGLPHLNK